jgi:hypothetical protein
MQFAQDSLHIHGQARPRHVFVLACPVTLIPGSLTMCGRLGRQATPDLALTHTGIRRAGKGGSAIREEAGLHQCRWTTTVNSWRRAMHSLHLYPIYTGCYLPHEGCDPFYYRLQCQINSRFVQNQKYAGKYDE